MSDDGVRRQRPAAFIGLALAVALYGLPLFLNLGGPDMGNDEALYSYSVDRIVQTGRGWLAPETVGGGPFLEKPPLKMILVAGAMTLGLTPHSDFGMRVFDATFGVGMFVYLYLFGLRIQGPLTGLFAGFIAFTFHSMVFDHGLRSNNMESAVVLAYCAGMFHFLRWVDADTVPARRIHAFSVAAACVLAFMTKFVAVAFLPIVCVLLMLSDRERRRALRERWREWLGPGLAAALCTAPWFIYGTIAFGAWFWQVLVGQHIVERFTSGLDPTHLQPWSFYFTEIWRELVLANTSWMVLGGVLFAAFRALVLRDWTARAILAWAVVPLALMSTGSSKIIHYALPFIPPLALAGGWLSGTFVDAIGRWSAPWFGSLRRLLPWRLPVRSTVVVGSVALAVAAWTTIGGPFRLDAGDITLFRNSSIVRPLVVGLVLFWLANRPRLVSTLVGVALLATFVVPVEAYRATVRKTAWGPAPLRALSECLRSNPSAASLRGRGAYAAVSPLPTHAYRYYLHDVAPVVESAEVMAEVERRLSDPARQSLVIVDERDYLELQGRIRARLEDRPGVTFRFPPAVRMADGLLVLMPGAFAACMAPTLAAGADPYDLAGFDGGR